MATLNWSINGLNFSAFGVSVFASDGITGMLKRKQTFTRNWEDYHGEQVDLSAAIFESREINLSCNIIATSSLDFLQKLDVFKTEFQKTGTQRLMLDYVTGKQLVYEVYLADGIEVQKQWREADMVGAFSLRLREPEPVKKVIKFIGPGTLNVAISSNSLLNFYWGDGTNTKNKFGIPTSNSHTYGSGTFYLVITGNIENAYNLSHNGTLIWDKLQ